MKGHLNTNRVIKGLLYVTIFLAAMLVLVVVLYAKSKPAEPDGNEGDAEEVLQETVTPEPAIPAYARALIKSYPDFVKGYEDGTLLFTDGSAMICDDGRQKDFLMRIDDADIEDMFYDRYVEGPLYQPTYLDDPGRYRCEAFFKKMYGQTEAEARKNLVPVEWFGQTLKFTSVNHAADSLRAVERDLKTLSPQYDKYFVQSSTFNWRSVRGASRLSPHSYGMAIDICVKLSNFWRWGNPGKSEVDKIDYANRIPEEIVLAFERHGFISGVKWYHYDTMHFEYRPELL